MKLVRKLLLGATLTCELGLSPAMANAASIQITAGYDYSSPNYVADTFFTVSNLTSSALTSILFEATGDGAAGSSDTATWSWAGTSLAAGACYTLYFPLDGSGVTGTGYGFTPDYEFLIAGNSQTYQFSALASGVLHAATFSPATNATGSFVGFLGNDIDGDSLPIDSSALVAEVDVAANQVPEPATTALLFAGGVLVLASGRRRRAAGAPVGRSLVTG